MVYFVWKLDGCHYPPYLLCLLHKKCHFWQLKKMKNDIYKTNLKKLSSATLFVITRHNYVSNMATLLQTMPRGCSSLRHLTRNLYMFIDDWLFCEEVFWKHCQNSCLSFFLSTSTHKRTPCQRISFFVYFFTFFYFVEKIVKMVVVPIHPKV